MKRKGNLYQEIYKFENIESAFEEVCRNTKNKRKVELFKEYKCTYIYRIYNILKNEDYHVGPYNVFTIKEPKERRIVSQAMIDKVINHLVARYIIYPAVLPCLLDFNVASRKDMGMRRGLELYQKYRQYFSSKYKHYYILKCDISKFFASIDHEILKEKLNSKIKDKKALHIVNNIIDSDTEGLSIGNMTSQILAIFYLNDMDHFIKENLKIKGVIRYQDDFLLFHESKEYLKYCLNALTKFLNKEKLKLNSKTRLYKDTDNFIFIGRNKYGKYAKYRTVKRRLKKREYLYRNGYITLSSLVSSRLCYKNLCNSKKSSI
jgi:hypothetical protein